MLPLIISSDSHVFEPPDLWQTRIDAAFRDRAPRIERIDGGAVGPKAWRLACEVRSAPISIRQIACIALSAALIFPSSDFGPHLVPLHTIIMPQRTEITQFIFGQPLSDHLVQCETYKSSD